MPNSDEIFNAYARGSLDPGAAPKYIYPLLHENKLIRILNLAPGETDDPLRGSLEVVDVDAAGSYETISYTWAEPGPPNLDYRIYIRHSDEDRLLDLRSGSLFAALRRLRRRNQECRIWADQICINQDDIKERGQQVQFMNKIYKNASHVLVWLGLDKGDEANSAFQLVHKIDEWLQNEVEREKFHHRFTKELERQSADDWKALDHLTKRSWFGRGWVVQEIGTEAPATIFWGTAEIDWAVLHRVCENLTRYHHLRKKFDIRTSDVKFLYKRFCEPDPTNYHANRFNFIYELHRARGLKFTDARDRIFAFLGHFALRTTYGPDSGPPTIKAEYTKSVEEVYTDIAKWALRSGHGDTALIALAAVQHVRLPPPGVSLDSTEASAIDEVKLPSWVPDWRTHQGFILSEPISPHYAHGTSKPQFKISEDNRTLFIHGVEVDTIQSCSRTLLNRDFHGRRDHEDSELAIENLWHKICQKDNFNLSDTYLNGQTAFFAFMQTLSNGSTQAAEREGKVYHDIPESRWFEEAAVYLVGALSESSIVAPELLEMAKNAESREVKEEWSRSANGASKNRVFARTQKGYYVLGPSVMEAGDIVCVLFGGKLPFCLRPVGERHMLVGECYAHGLMKAEAMNMMNRKELAEKVFQIV